MDIDRYRKQYERELARVTPKAVKREAIAGGAPTARARADAILAAPLDEHSLDTRVPELLAILQGRKQPVVVRQAALQVLSAMDFLGPRFAPYRAVYKLALRELVTDPRVSIRESVLELLAIEQDPYAQEVLVRGLERPQDALVPDAKALQFLAYDDHAELAPLARRVFRRSTGVAREEALRLLANDPKSETLLRRLLTDKSETSSVRRLSASGLQSLNPPAFERAARKIVADDGDYDEIRATSLAALAHQPDATTDAKFVATVEDLQGSTRSRALKSSSARYLRAIEP